jgi:site-specific recombinase XerD
MTSTGLSVRTEPLFQNRRGTRFSRWGIRYVLNKHVQAVRRDHPGFIRSVSPHSIRHTKGMHLLQSGVSLEIIRDFLGHVDVQTTQIYARSNLEMKRRALEKIEDGVPPTENSVLEAEQDVARLVAFTLTTGVIYDARIPGLRYPA